MAMSVRFTHCKLHTPHFTLHAPRSAPHTLPGVGGRGRQPFSIRSQTVNVADMSGPGNKSETSGRQRGDK